LSDFGKHADVLGSRELVRYVGIPLGNVVRIVFFFVTHTNRNIRGAGNGENSCNVVLSNFEIADIGRAVVSRQIHETKIVGSAQTPGICGVRSSVCSRLLIISGQLKACQFGGYEQIIILAVDTRGGAISCFHLVGRSDVNVLQLDIDTNGIVAIGTGVIETVFINGFNFNGLLNTKLIGSKILLTEGERGNAILQPYVCFFQVAAVLIFFGGIFEAKIQTTESRQVIAQIIGHVVLQLQIVIFNVSTLIEAGCLTELDLEITVQLVSKTVFLIHSRSVDRANSHRRHSNSQKKLLHFLTPLSVWFDDYWLLESTQLFHSFRVFSSAFRYQ